MPSHQRLGLLAALCCAAALTAAIGSTVECPSFVRVLARPCLRVEFSINVSVPAAADEVSCSLACLGRGPGCRGFRLLVSQSQCQLFEFDRCTRGVGLAETECRLRQFQWIFVRQRPGLPRGRLCPDGFGHARLGSVYRLVDVADWNDGLAKCESSLTKLADADSRAEVDYLHWIKQNVNSGQSFFIGGFRPGSSASDPWFWHGCNTSLLPELWGSGQPNEGASANRANIWSSHSYGVDDVTNYYSSIKRALCECVDPFVV